jgi:hypothetical protein
MEHFDKRYIVFYKITVNICRSLDARVYRSDKLDLFYLKNKHPISYKIQSILFDSKNTFGL